MDGSIIVQEHSTFKVNFPLLLLTAPALKHSSLQLWKRLYFCNELTVRVPQKTVAMTFLADYNTLNFLGACVLFMPLHGILLGFWFIILNPRFIPNNNLTQYTMPVFITLVTNHTGTVSSLSTHLTLTLIMPRS